jgi:HEAT repeat protein
MLTDRSSRVRQQAAYSLALIGGVKARKSLIAMLEDASLRLETRRLACYALAFLFDDEVLETLVELVSSVKEHPEVRAQAAEGIANLLEGADRRSKEWRQAVAVLLLCLDERSIEVRFWAVFALGCLRAKKALPALGRIAKSDKRKSSMGWTVAEEAHDAIYCIRHGTWPESM